MPAGGPGAASPCPLPASAPCQPAPSLLRDRRPVGPWPLGVWPPCLVSVSSEASGVAGGEETWIRGSEHLAQGFGGSDGPLHSLKN